MTTQPESFLPIDCGFDGRLHDMLFTLATLPVRYLEGQGPHATPRLSSEDRETAAVELANAKYSTVVYLTPNGRQVRCEPVHGSPQWSVQPPRDNYWCTGPTLASVLDQAGWKRDELTIPGQ